jgi:putative thiamine transport system substrate-binding protein
MLKHIAAALLILLCATMDLAAGPDPSDWNAVVAEARGQTVYWHAWGGDPRINDYIAWAGEETKSTYGVTVKHVKIADTAAAVSRVLGEKAAGRDSGGAVDLIWINGENFAAMKANKLLFGPWAEQLPNWRYVDHAGNPAVKMDFTIATDGFEAPWGKAQLVFYYDSERLADPPRTIPALVQWARENPGRFSYPQPPDFLGTTFLKQALYELSDDLPVLLQPPELSDFDTVTQPLWSFLDQLTPVLWRAGKAYPQNGSRLRQLMADGEIDLALSFNPGEVSAAVANFELAATVRSYILAGGTIGNTSFVAIPYNASAKAGAMVLANFLLSAQAQARMQDPLVWGSFTVLDIARLPGPERAWFERQPRDTAALTPEQLGTPLPEPHPDWLTRVEEQWQRRYGIAR